MASTALVPVTDLRIDPALTPAFYAACGALPVRRRWYEVDEDHVQCCLTTALAAGHVGLALACSASACVGDGTFLDDIDNFREVSAVPLSAPYLAGLVAGWDGCPTSFNADPLEQAARDFGLDAANPATAAAYLAGHRAGAAARDLIDRLEAPPGYPLASASDLRIEATDDDEEDDIDDDDEEFDDDDDEDDEDDEDEWEDEE